MQQQCSPIRRTHADRPGFAVKLLCIARLPPPLSQGREGGRLRKAHAEAIVVDVDS